MYFPNNIFFPVASLMVGIQQRIHMTHKIRVTQLFLLSVRLLVNNGLLAAKVFGEGGGQSGMRIFHGREVWAAPPELFKGQLYNSLLPVLLELALPCCRCPHRGVK